MFCINFLETFMGLRPLFPVPIPQNCRGMLMLDSRYQWADGISDGR